MTAPLLDELNRDQDLAYRLLAKRDYVQASKLFEKLFEQGVRAGKILPCLQAVGPVFDPPIDIDGHKGLAEFCPQRRLAVRHHL